MHLPTAILGKGTVVKLEERQSSAVLVIGDDKFTRPQLSKIGCFNFMAASRLTQYITELKIKNTRELFQTVPPQHLALPGLGPICLATIGAAFEVKGLGTLADYIARHTEKGHLVVTFATMKHNVRDQEAAREEKKAAKKRKASRNDRAQNLRADRHIARAEKTPTTEGETE